MRKTSRVYGEVWGAIRSVAASRPTFTRRDVPVAPERFCHAAFDLIKKGEIKVVKRGGRGCRPELAVYSKA